MPLSLHGFLPLHRLLHRSLEKFIINHMLNFIKTSVKPPDLSKEVYIFAFYKNDILVKDNGKERVSIPLIKADKASLQLFGEKVFIGLLDNKPCFCACIHPEYCPDQYKFINLRALYGKIEDKLWLVSGYARQISDWNLHFKFCGRCGSKTIRHENEYVRTCKKCSLSSYPRISPAVITAVVKNDSILLARGANFPNKKMFSVLAGFVEPGESLEECVKREIFEETRIKVKNIKYFKSQSWPFPDSLMIGFTAEYDRGELVIDREEIEQAGWFKKEELPMVPANYTLAGELINWFINIPDE